MDPALDDAVLNATSELLAERGYQRLRVGDVAARAGVGLGALYRRWPGKRDLVLAALERAVPDRGLPDSDDPATDVLAGWRAIVEALTGPRGRLLTGLLPEFDTDPELAETVRRVVLAAVREQNRERLRRLVGDTAELDLVADLGPAYILFQGVFLGRSIDEAELRSLLAAVRAIADRAG